ncbi:hypothetical protein H6P81_013233 [Aristolochia fimbriata]|uniref:Uncharacterized protein n=1 Tax=Aristolochia fimbriata TaxID=158543 RepID=A0AAV7EE50_ARIFI|nr:hypothetical protein H6P81_013233 [Aristolochia fimbriata]
MKFDGDDFPALVAANQVSEVASPGNDPVIVADDGSVQPIAGASLLTSGTRPARSIGATILISPDIEPSPLIVPSLEEGYRLVNLVMQKTPEPFGVAVEAPVIHPSSEKSFTSTPASPSTRLKLRHQISALGLWAEFVKLDLLPAIDLSARELVDDSHFFLDKLRDANIDTSVLERWVDDFSSSVARLRQLNKSQEGKVSPEDQLVVEARIALLA